MTARSPSGQMVWDRGRLLFVLFFLTFLTSIIDCLQSPVDDTVSDIDPFDIILSPSLLSFLRLTGGPTDAQLVGRVSEVLRRRGYATISFMHAAPVRLLQDVLGVSPGQFSSLPAQEDDIDDEDAPL